MPNKWLEWTPDWDEITPESPTREPSKPSEQGFDGFEGQPLGLLPIIQDHEEGHRSCADVIEKAGDRTPSKPPEPSTNSEQARAPDILAPLSGRPATCAQSCYAVEPSRWIHRPWNGCKTQVSSREPYIPSRADCGCDGPVCSRCFLCPELCQCRLQHVGPEIVGVEIK